MGTVNNTQLILQDLWRKYGSFELPAEWDGNVYGGGKLSQRYWELLTTVRYGEFGPDSVVLDLGGSGEGVDKEKWHGAGFLARLLAPHVRQVWVADPACSDGTYANVACIKACAFEPTSKWIKAELAMRTVTHVTCVSVLEHIPQPERLRMLTELHDFARTHGVQTIVLTCEYHPTRIFWPHVLDAMHLSECVSLFTDYYLDRYEASPTHCVNAMADGVLPMWYPISIRLHRAVT